MFYQCPAFGQKISVLQNGVALGNKWNIFDFIPFSDIRKAVLQPALENAPSSGGCLKLVTDDNPDLPVRDSHSFHMQGKSEGSKGDDTCFFYNCFHAKHCIEANAEVEKIKALIESKI